LPIWVDFMKAVLEGRPSQAFHPPPGLVQATVDPATGEVAHAGCPTRVTEVFIAAPSPGRFARCTARLQRKKRQPPDRAPSSHVSWCSGSYASGGGVAIIAGRENMLHRDRFGAFAVVCSVFFRSAELGVCHTASPTATGGANGTAKGGWAVGGPTAAPAPQGSPLLVHLYHAAHVNSRHSATMVASAQWWRKPVAPSTWEL